MRILSNIKFQVDKFMSDKDLPLHGKAFAWALAVGAWAVVLLGIAFGLKYLFAD